MLSYVTTVKSARKFVITKKNIKTKKGVIPDDTICEIIKEGGNKLLIEAPDGEQAFVNTSQVEEI